MELLGKRVCVTGGAGFVGSHVVDQLATDNQVLIVDNFSTGEWSNIQHHLGNPRVRVEEIDIRDLASMTRVLQGIDIVFHLAVACVRACFRQPILVQDVNATGTLTTCEASRVNGVQKFVYVSTSEVYGSARYVPMDEKHPLDPPNVYGASKLAGEFYALSYARMYGLPVSIVRLFNCYGPREHYNGTSAEVIPKFVMRAMAGLPPIVFGSGEQTRDFTWVEEQARGIVAAASCDELENDVVHLGRGHGVSVGEVARKVLDKVGRNDLPVVHMDPRPADVGRHEADIAKANRLFGYAPEVSIDEGLDRYIHWVQTQNVDLRLWAQQESVQNW